MRISFRGCGIEGFAAPVGKSVVVLVLADLPVKPNAYYKVSISSLLDQSQGAKIAVNREA